MFVCLCVFSCCLFLDVCCSDDDDCDISHLIKNTYISSNGTLNENSGHLNKVKIRSFFVLLWKCGSNHLTLYLISTKTECILTPIVRLLVPQTRRQEVQNKEEFYKITCNLKSKNCDLSWKVLLFSVFIFVFECF